MIKYFKTILAKIFQKGCTIPQSIAIIMDGNRRFADKNKVEKIQGHEQGLNKLLEVIQWSIDLNIKEITVFAFSIDNFNRPKNEFEALMSLANDKFTKLSDKNELFQRYGIRVSIYGNISMLDKKLSNSLIRMESDTVNNSVIKLNVCFAYNSTEELSQAVHSYKSDKVPSQHVSDFEAKLYGGYNCKPDLLIRTSGEVRLSNFLLYQTRFSMIFFIDKYWPEFTFWDYIKIIVRYSLNYKYHIRDLKELENSHSFKIC